MSETDAPEAICARDTDCPIETTIAVIGGKWKAVILFHLRTGPKRFNALRRLVPTATQRMLTAHLRELERDGIISRTVHAVVPPRVDYALTELGWTLTPLMHAMADWGRTYEARLARPAGGAGGSLLAEEAA